jgi:hypothetical protein
MTIKLLATAAVAAILCISAFGQGKGLHSGTVTLDSRRVDRAIGADNYVNATYSFEKGTNGEKGLKQTRNDWDLEFSSMWTADGTIRRNVFDVTMVDDDRSHIRDLGKLDWSDDIRIPVLPALKIPTKEKPVEAKVGHIYLVHAADSDSDLYALFRLDEMRSRESATITWKRIKAPTEN